MDIGTNTKVAAVSKIKMATAFLFLGGAALAASAAGGVAGKQPANGPDLVIKSVYLEAQVQPEGKGGGPTSGYDLYTVTYENIGNMPVNKPFHISVQSSPAPYMTWGGGDPVMYLALNDAVDGDGYSGGFSELVMKPAKKMGNTNLYAIPVDNPTFPAASISDIYPGLNMYNLNGVSVSPGDGYSGGLPQPGGAGQIKVYISKMYQEMIGKGNKSRIGFFIDYPATPGVNKRNGVVLEKNENNNSKTEYFDKSKYATVPSNLCSADYIAPELAKDICATQGGSYICIDKYTQWYSACVPNPADCAKKIKTTVPCEVDFANGQPYFDTIEMVMGGKDWQAAKTFSFSYAKGNYPAGNMDLTTLYYPYEKKGKIDLVRLKLSAKNVSTSTTYGFFADGSSSINYPGDTAVYSGFTNLFGSKVVWNPKNSSIQFKPTTDIITLYIGVKNSDDIYLGFPNTKIADDAIAIQIIPMGPAPASSTPPYPTSTPPYPTSTPPYPPATPPAAATQPSIQSVEFSGPGPLLMYNQSKVQGNLAYPGTKFSSWTWNGPTDMKVHVNAVNALNAEYGFYVNYNGYMDPDYLLSSYGSGLVWSKSPDFTFSSKDSSWFTVYTFVRNGDDVSVAGSKVDDYSFAGIQKNYTPPPAPPTPPTTTPPYSTSTLSVTVNEINPKSITAGNDQLVGDFNFTAIGNAPLCLTKIYSTVNASSGDIQFGALKIADEMGNMFSTASPYNYNFSFSPKLCIEPNTTKRLKFYLDGVNISYTPYPVYLVHTLINATYENAITGDTSTNSVMQSNGALYK